MLAALCRFDLRIPGCTSLKEKRHAVKTLTSSVRNKFNVSVAEVDHHDLWQRAAIAVAVVAESNRHLEEVLGTIERFVRSSPEVEVLDTATAYLEPEE